MNALRAARRESLIDRLPAVRGQYIEQAPLAKTMWFRVGGPAEVLFSPADVADLQHFLKARPHSVPVTTIGVGSNLLVRDGGLRGVVIRLGRAFARIEVDGQTISAGAAAMDVNVARTAARRGLAGLEFLSGVPGTVGGALRMNAGAYGSEIADVLIEAEALDAEGERRRLTVEDMGFSYRCCAVPDDWIFVSARVRARPGVQAEIEGRMAEIAQARTASQPIRSRTGGSTFKNPGGPDPAGPKAWRLIDQAGCRGLTRGAAQVSEQHCNFLINTGGATAADLEGLGEEVRARVRRKTGIELVWEIRRIGAPAGAASECGP